MSIIYSYPEQGATVNPNDMLIGTSATKIGGKQKNLTKNFTVQQIADFINDGTSFIDPVASDFQIAIFNQSGLKITGSIMSQNTFPNGTGITVSGNLTTTGDLTASGNISLGGGAPSATISLLSETTLTGPIKDTRGVLSIGNQILLSNGNSQLVWQDYEAGLTYEGTWNATTNTTNGLTNSPALVPGVGTSGHFYIVNVAGTTNLGNSGSTLINDWEIGDWAVFFDEGSQAASWQKIDNSSVLTGEGTANKITMWTGGVNPSTSLTDSLISQDSPATTVTITGALTTTGNVNAGGSVIATANVSAVNITATTTVTPKTITDKDSGVGTAGQILSSTVTGVEWIDNQAGTVTGTGTQYKVPLWSNVAGTALGDSLFTQDSSATKVTLDGLLEVLGDGTSQDGRIKLNCYLNTHAVTIQSPPHAFTPASYTLILPTVPGSANQVLTSNGFNSNQLFWSTPKLGTVTNFTTVSTAISGITTAVTNPTTTPELTLSITGSPTAALFLDGTGNWSSPGGGVSSVTFNSTLAASTGDALSITPTTGAVVINAKTFDGANKPGVITAASGDAANFLRGDGTWASPSGASATITSNQTTTINATTTVFALGATPNGSSVNFVDAFIDGVYQETTTYSVSGQNLTFNDPVPSGVTVETKTTADYNVGAVVTTASLGQTNTTGNVNLRIIPNYIISSITAQANNLYIFDSTTQAYTLTLPSSPQPGDSIKISIRGGLATNTLAVPATENIMGGVLGVSLVINNATAAFEIIYSGDSTKQGWVIIGNV